MIQNYGQKICLHLSDKYRIPWDWDRVIEVGLENSYPSQSVSDRSGFKLWNEILNDIDIDFPFFAK